MRTWTNSTHAEDHAMGDREPYRVGTHSVGNIGYKDVVAKFITRLYEKWPVDAYWGKYGNVYWRNVMFHDTLGFTVGVNGHKMTTYLPTGYDSGGDGSGPTYLRWVGPGLTSPLPDVLIAKDHLPKGDYQTYQDYFFAS